MGNRILPGLQAMVPIGDPEYVVVVMLEEAGGGGSNASPIAEKIYRYLFGLDTLDNRKEIMYVNNRKRQGRLSKRTQFFQSAVQEDL